MLLNYFRAIKALQREVKCLKKAFYKCKNTKEREVIKKQIEEFETIISNFKKITDSFIGNCKDEVIKNIIIDCYYNNKSFPCALDLYAPFEDDQDVEDDKDDEDDQDVEDDKDGEDGEDVEDDEDGKNNKEKKRTYKHHYDMYYKRIYRLLT